MIDSLLETLERSGSGPVRVRVHSRLIVERRILGLVAVIATLAMILAGIWTYVILGRALLFGLGLGRLALLACLPLAATMAVLVHVSSSLPTTRWLSDGRRRPPSPLLLGLSGTPSLLLWPALAMRDRRARRDLDARAARAGEPGGQDEDKDEVELAFRSLLVVPRMAAGSMLVWLSVAAFVDLAVLTEALALDARTAAMLASTWVVALLPATSLVATRLRAMLIPELLSAPRPDPSALPLHRSLRLRLGAPAGMTLVAATTALPVIASAWGLALGPELNIAPSPALAWTVVLFGVIAGLASLQLLMRDVERDLGRASQQIGSVARGEIPEPMAVESFASLELREMIGAVDRLVGRITDANVTKYILIEHGQEADRLKSQFLANMSHDLRSPLNSVIGFSELLMTGIEGELAADQRAMVESIHVSGRNLLRQIDDILDTAKLEAGHMELHREPTPPATLLSRAIQNARPLLAEGLDITTRIAAGLPPAFADPYRTVQAIENALKFAGEGLERGTVELSCAAEREGERANIVIRVSTPRELESVEALEQARRGFVRVAGQTGLGLGLPIATAIFELQSGTVTVEDLRSSRVSSKAPAMVIELRIPALTARRKLRLRED